MAVDGDPTAPPQPIPHSHFHFGFYDHQHHPAAHLVQPFTNLSTTPSVGAVNLEHGNVSHRSSSVTSQTPAEEVKQEEEQASSEVYSTNVESQHPVGTQFHPKHEQLSKYQSKLISSPLHIHGTGGHNTDSHCDYRLRQTALNHDQAGQVTHEKIDLVRVTYVDAANIPRCRLLPLKRFLSNTVHKGQALTAAIGAFTCVMDAPAPDSGLTTTGDVQMMPDLASFRVLPTHQGHAHVLCDMVTKTGEPWPHCPRGFLKRQLVKLREEHQLELVAGFESEFYLLKDGKGVDGSLYAENRSLSGFGGRVFDEILRTLLKAGVEVENSHPESGNGQFEIAGGADLALDTIDELIFVREIIHEIAASHGLTATFSPKPFANQAGNGQHVHLSLMDAETGANVFPEKEGEISERGKQFMAGILAHLPALCALTMPTSASYQRVKPHVWAGAYTCWGMDNKEAPLRVPTNAGATNVEVKCLDATGNPYLAIGALLACGLDGLVNKLELAEGLSGDPADLDVSEQARLGIKPLPTSLSEALDNLEKDLVLKEALGEELLKSFVATRRFELSLLSRMTEDEARALYTSRY